MSSETTSQFVLGLMNTGPGALQHPGEALKEKNAGCGMKTEHSFLQQGEGLRFSLGQYLPLVLLISETAIENFQ